MNNKNSFDCKKFVPNICKTYIVAAMSQLEKNLLRKLFKRNRNVVKEVDLGGEILPETKDKQCTFLDDNYPMFNL